MVVTVKLQTLILALFFNGCFQDSNPILEDAIRILKNNSNSNVLDSTSLLQEIAEIKPVNYLYKFRQTSCRHNSADSDTIDSYTKDELDHTTKFTKYFKNDTLVVTADQQATCKEKYDGDILFVKDTLFLILNDLGIDLGKGKLDTNHLPLKCYCRYNFAFSIAGVSKIPKHLQTMIKRN